MKKLALAAAALVAMGGTAFAADLTPIAPPAPPPPMAPGFSWDGPYAGIYGGDYIGFGFQTGVTVGANFTGGSSFLFGVEAQVGAIFLAPPTVLEADLNARVGFILGAQDRLLIYGEGGIGFGGGAGFWTGGGGIEIGIGDSLSVFTEAKAAATFGGGFNGILVQGGLNWHFGGM